MEFTRDIIVPFNYTSFNDSTLNISVIPGEISNPNNLNFTWKIIDMSSREITIDLLFKTPLFVSYYDLVIPYISPFRIKSYLR